MDDPRLTIGGNQPPEPIEILRAHLRETHAALKERADALLSMAERLPPPDEMDGAWAEKITEAIKDCTKFVTHCEATRLAANEPHRALIKATDAFFKGMSDPVDTLKTRMAHRHLTPWQKRVAAAELRRRTAAAAEALRVAEEERARASAEADALIKIKRAEDQARQAEDAAALERLAVERREQERLAAAAREGARVAAQERNLSWRAANAGAADLSRARTEKGAVASLQTTFGFNVIDPAKVPRAYLSVNQAAITAAIRAATRYGVCDLEIDGVEIFPIVNSVVR
jgi:hypothetical protein